MPMSDYPFHFDATYDDAMIHGAAKVFVRRQFGKYLAVLAVACLLAIGAFVFVLMLPGNGRFATVPTGLVAVLGPMLLLLMYLRLPGKLAAALGRRLKPAASVSVSAAGVSIVGKGLSFTRTWAELTEVVEFPEYFLFAVAPLAFTLVPKKDIPQAAQQLIREASL